MTAGRTGQARAACGTQQCCARTGEHPRSPEQEPLNGRSGARGAPDGCFCRTLKLHRAPLGAWTAGGGELSTWGGTIHAFWIIGISRGRQDGCSADGRDWHAFADEHFRSL